MRAGKENNYWYQEMEGGMQEAIFRIAWFEEKYQYWIISNKLEQSQKQTQRLQQMVL